MTRRAGWVAALIGLAAGLSGGGASASAPPPAAPAPPPASAAALTAVRDAATAIASGSALFRLTLSGATAFGATPANAQATGSFDFRNMRGSASLRPAGSAAPEPVVFAPMAVYVRPPAPPGFLPPGTSWVVAHFADPGPLSRNFPQLVVQVESIDPGLAVEQLLWGGVDAADAGPDRLGPLRATRYDVTLDLARAAAHASGPARTPFALALAAQAAVVTRTRVHVWIADGGWLAGVQMLPRGAGVGVATMTFGAYGTSVVASPPPASQTADIATITPFGERENQNGGDADGA